MLVGEGTLDQVIDPPDGDHPPSPHPARRDGTVTAGTPDRGARDRAAQSLDGLVDGQQNLHDFNLRLMSPDYAILLTKDMEACYMPYK